MKTINVTKNDIKMGWANDCCLCPIARAIKRHTNNKSVRVFSQMIEIDYHRLHLPTDASNFVLRFDKGRRVKPFKFKLDIPKNLLKRK